MSAKISDYGISAFVTPLGLMTDKGSPMYQAPEVRGGNVLYDNKVDVYSFGIVLHQLLTNRRPSISDECDSFVETDDVLQDIASLGCPPWPDMERLITLCTKQVPEQRPTSEEVFTSFNSDEMLGLRRVIPLWKQFTVESAVVMMIIRINIIPRTRNEVAEVDLNYGVEEVVVKDVATLGNGDFTEERIESVLCVDNETVVFANLKKKLWICDCQKRVTMRAETSEAVISLQQYDGWVEDGVVFAGQSNGQIAVFSTKDLKSDCTRCEPREVITVADNKVPIRCMTIARDKLWLGTRNRNVTTLGCRVKSIFLQQHTAMWIGTYNGYVLLVDPTAYTAIAVMRRHTGPVAAILSSPKTGHGNTSSFIVTVGVGFCDVSHNETEKGETEATTYALIWDGNTSSRVKAHYEYRTRRRQLHQPGI
ncbi:leucine-rich repeat serine/threonine-protein kinase 2-like [Ptychodera flava]|uniref:leucine-rich repeat serine/threonine-protein kinase 2-like n=1 Tax=Ptychodera flava TaxID=63121 RepID=UPI003969FA3E